MIECCKRCAGSGYRSLPSGNAVTTCEDCDGDGKVFVKDQTPAHYQSATGVTPWDLQRGMQTSGGPFVDARRADAIKYAFRVKTNMVEDLRKAAHCLLEAAAELERRGGEKEPPLTSK